MELLHRQLLGLAVIVVMVLIIVAFAPSIRRLRHIGDTTRANRRTGLMISLMAAVAAIGFARLITG